MADRIAELKEKGMVFDDPPSAEVRTRIDSLPQEDYEKLRDTITPHLSSPKSGPTLRYQNGGFQFRAFEK